MTMFDISKEKKSNPWHVPHQDSLHGAHNAITTEPALQNNLQVPLISPVNAQMQAVPFAGMYEDSVTKQKGTDETESGTETTQDPSQDQSPDAEKHKNSPEKEKKRKIKALKRTIAKIHRLDRQTARLEKKGNAADAELKRHESAALKEQAIEKAVDAYDINVSNAKFIDYDPNTTGEGGANRKGEIRLGDDAFKSASWLGSTIGHESEIHINQQAMKGNWYTGTMGTAIQEVQAYQYELDNVKRFGTSKRDRGELHRRKKSYMSELNQEYQDRAKSGDYTMKHGEEHR